MGYYMKKINLLRDNILREFRTPALYVAILLGMLGFIIWAFRNGDIVNRMSGI